MNYLLKLQNIKLYCNILCILRNLRKIYDYKNCISNMRLPDRRKVKLAIMIIGLFWAVGLSVFFAYMLAFVYANGGVLTLDMTLLNEQHIEYWLMVLIVPILTLALFFFIEQLPEYTE